MTVERARELLNLGNMSDEEIKSFIARQKQLCSKILKMIISKHTNHELTAIKK